MKLSIRTRDVTLDVWSNLAILIDQKGKNTILYTDHRRTRENNRDSNSVTRSGEHIRRYAKCILLPPPSSVHPYLFGEARVIRRNNLIIIWNFSLLRMKQLRRSRYSSRFTRMSTTGNRYPFDVRRRESKLARTQECVNKQLSSPTWEAIANAPNVRDTWMKNVEPLSLSYSPSPSPSPFPSAHVKTDRASISTLVSPSFR